MEADPRWTHVRERSAATRQNGKEALGFRAAPMQKKSSLGSPSPPSPHNPLGTRPPDALQYPTRRRDGGVVERAGLENRIPRKRNEGSNPSLSAIPLQPLPTRPISQPPLAALRASGGGTRVLSSYAAIMQ